LASRFPSAGEIKGETISTFIFEAVSPVGTEDNKPTEDGATEEKDDMRESTQKAEAETECVGLVAWS
jgi:hypothetical protein